MSDEIKFDNNSIEIDEDGFVIGAAFIGRVDENGEYDVSCGVFSYEYRKHGEVKMNHVPTVVVTKLTGEIVAEPNGHDSPDPETAIENAENTAMFVAENIEEYV